jgi:hypothetical protein
MWIWARTSDEGNPLVVMLTVENVWPMTMEGSPVPPSSPAFTPTTTP